MEFIGHCTGQEKAISAGNIAVRIEDDVLREAAQEILLQIADMMEEGEVYPEDIAEAIDDEVMRIEADYRIADQEWIQQEIADRVFAQEKIR